MKKERCDILLIGYEEGENLGLRSMVSFLEQYDIVTRFETYTPDSKPKVLKACNSLNPSIVGFSLIFQRFLPDFAELISHLRDHGIKCHFTMGGHFPSVESEKVMDYIPALDSIVRCEGEITILELFRHIKSGKPLSGIPGLTFRSGSEIVISSPRKLIGNLDDLPFPKREKCSFEIMGIGVSTILGSRGCFYDCSFCSIRQFYNESQGPKRRARSPGNVIDEMEMLYKKLGSRIFIFEDDDFYAHNKIQKRWVNEFLNELIIRELDKKFVWRISCRIDDIEEEILKKMADCGLLCVYIGIEAGNDTSLKTYNKRYNTAIINRSITILEKLHLYYEFGFMILNPYCTLETIREDVDFLKRIGQSGLAIAQFTKMVPYAGTPIEIKLKTEERLTGTLDSPDYGYPDPRIALMENYLYSAFHHRNFNTNGLVEKLRYLKFYISLLKKYHPEIYVQNNCASKTEQFIKDANRELLEKTSMAVTLMSGRDEKEIIRLWPILEDFIRETKSFEKSMTSAIDSFYQKLMQEVNSCLLSNALYSIMIFTMTSIIIL